MGGGLLSNNASVPAPGVREGVVDVDVLGGKSKLLLKNAADLGGRAIADGTLGTSEQLDLDHGKREIALSAEPHSAVVGEAKHQPLLGFAGENRDRLSKTALQDRLLFGGDADVGLCVDQWHGVNLPFFFII